MNLPEKTHKLVRQDSFTTDQHFIKFLNPYEVTETLKTMNFNTHSIKEIHPSKIRDLVSTDFDHYLLSLIPEDEVKRVFSSDAIGDICYNLLSCDTEMYYRLSQIIPKDFTVIDIGCGYNAQSYFFKDHKRYIGVNPASDFDQYHFERFKADNTFLYITTGQDFIETHLPLIMFENNKTFAICNFVPDEECRRMVRQTFENCYVYYPHK